jgi:hypothetical protein
MSPAAPTATRTPRTRILLNLLSASAGQWVAGRDIADSVGPEASIYIRELQRELQRSGRSISERVERHNGQVLRWYRLNRDARW